MSDSEIFDRIYLNKYWGDGGTTKPLSGSGSNPINAKPYVEFVKKSLIDFEIRTVLDFGHGDMKMWGKYRFDEVDYVGLDVSKSTGESITAENRPNMKLLTLDFKVCPLPKAELFISKDVLQHLPNKTIDLLFSKLNSFKYLIICNDIFLKENVITELKLRLQIRARLKSLKQGKFFSNRMKRKNNVDIVIGEVRGIDLEEEFFAKKLSNFALIHKFDYDGPKRVGIKKRVYVLKNIV
jgi:hypothetical protein